MRLEPKTALLEIAAYAVNIRKVRDRSPAGRPDLKKPLN
jgi:hypothetical protein